MASAATPSLVRQLRSLFAGGSAAGLSDRELLERFIADRGPDDQAAFAALVARHGPMVLGLCRQLLGDHHHAEDAFQAVFLVLARQARSIRDPDLLGHWLYGVALRTARKAYGRLDRRRRTEEVGAARRPEACLAEQPRRMLALEQAEALHGEIDRLPDSFRLPVVLCYFEGLSPDEAARRLRWPSGTLRSRLVRARDKLRRGLIRRGLVPSAIGMAAVRAPRSAPASVSSLLCETTARAAIAFAARHAAGVPSALAREVLQTTLAHKLKTAALSVLVLATLAAGALSLSHDALARSREGEPPGEPRPHPARQEPRPPDPPRPSPGRMIVSGRVLRPDGRPAAGVPVDLIAAPRIPMAGTDAGRAPYVVLGQGAADGDGRFHVEAARAASSRFYDVFALAGAAGGGTAFGCVKVHPDAEQPTAEIHLPPEQVIRGKLVDVNGQPVAGVQVQLASVYSESKWPGGGRFVGPRSALFYGWPAAPVGLKAWPRPVATDVQGRFTFTGVGRGLDASLAVRDPRFAQQAIRVQTDNTGGPKDIAAALQPATIIEGRVLADDTGQPIPDAVLSISSRFAAASGGRTMKFRADGQGRFRINPYAGDTFSCPSSLPTASPTWPGRPRSPGPRERSRRRSISGSHAAS
jgi:RNA polymerase sigma factor (sigma-70 family)